MLSALIALLIAEGIARVVDKTPPTISGWRSLDNRPLERNQLGFRGHPIEYAKDDFVIVLLGDSSVEASACSYELTPERRLQFHLNSTGRKVRVVSLGAGGYGQDQQLLILREYLEKFRADMVVHWFAGTNDIWNNVFPTHFPADGAAKPTYWLEGGQLRGPTEGMGQPIRETPRLKLQLLWRNQSNWSRDGEWEKLLPPPYKPMTEPDGPVKDDWQQRWDSNAKHMRNENLATEKTHYSIFLTPGSERMKYGLDLTHRLLQEIEHLIQSRGGRLVVFANDLPPEERSRREGLHVLQGKYYKTSMDQYYRNLDYVLRDLTFYSIPITIENWKVSADNSHLNEQANDQLMKDLAKRIEPLIPSR